MLIHVRDTNGFMLPSIWEFHEEFGLNFLLDAVAFLLIVVFGEKWVGFINIQPLHSSCMHKL